MPSTPTQPPLNVLYVMQSSYFSYAKDIKMPEGKPVSNTKQTQPIWRIKISGSKDNFTLKMDQSRKVRAYGHTNTPFETILLRGNMPDNGIGSLKMLNCIGKNLLHLERQDAIEAHAAGKSISAYYQENLHSIPAFTRKVDLAVNMHSAKLLQILGALEKNRPNALSGEEQQEIKGKIEQLTRETNLHIQSLAGNNEFLKDRAAHICTKLNVSLHQLVSEPVLSKENQPINDYQYQKVFRAALQQYQMLETTVSSWNGFTLNYSATEAYQDASAALTEHVASAQKPTAAQLWELPPQGTAVLDTRKYPGMARDDVYHSLCAGSEHPQKKFDHFQTKIKTAQIKFKEGKPKTDKNPLQVPKAMSAAQLGTVEKQFAANVDKVVQGLSKPEQVDAATFVNLVAQEVIEYDVPEAKSVHLHVTNDLLAAGTHVLDVATGFISQEMAAKHPGLTFATFTLEAATFGFGALIAANQFVGLSTAYMKILGAAIHKISGGHISAASVQHAVSVIDESFKEFAHCDSFFKSLLIDVLAMPTLTYMAAEELVGKPLDPTMKTTIDKIMHSLRTSELLHESKEEQMTKTIVHITTAALVLGAIAGTGVLSAYLASLPSLAAPLKATASFVSDLADFSAGNVTPLVTASGVLPELIAVASVIFAVKATAVVAGKLAITAKHLFHENADPQRAQEIGILNSLYDLQQDDPRAFKRAIDILPSDVLKNIYNYTLNAELKSTNEKEKNTFISGLQSVIRGQIPGLEVPTAEPIPTWKRVLGKVGDNLQGMFNKTLLPVLAIIPTGLIKLCANKQFPIESIKSRAQSFTKAAQNEAGWRRDFLMAGNSALKSVAILGSVTWNAAKIVVNSTYGAGVLAIKAVGSAFIKTAMWANAALKNPGLVKDAVLNSIDKLGAAVVSGVCGICRGLARTVGVLTAAAVGIATTAITLPIAAGCMAYGVGKGIREGMACRAQGQAFSSGFKTGIHEGAELAKSVLKTPIRPMIVINESSKIMKETRASIDGWQQSLAVKDKNIQGRLIAEVSGNDTLENGRAYLVEKVSQVATDLKNSVGEISMAVRTHTVRSQDESIQGLSMGCSARREVAKAELERLLPHAPVKRDSTQQEPATTNPDLSSSKSHAAKNWRRQSPATAVLSVNEPQGQRATPISALRTQMSKLHAESTAASPTDDMEKDPETNRRHTSS